jgi:hypothetical protein
MSAKEAEFQKMMRQQRVYEGGRGLLVQQPGTPELKRLEPEEINRRMQQHAKAAFKRKPQ